MDMNSTSTPGSWAALAKKQPKANNNDNNNKESILSPNNINRSPQVRRNSQHIIRSPPSQKSSPQTLANIVRNSQSKVQLLQSPTQNPKSKPNHSKSKLLQSPTQNHKSKPNQSKSTPNSRFSIMKSSPVNKPTRKSYPPHFQLDAAEGEAKNSKKKSFPSQAYKKRNNKTVDKERNPRSFRGVSLDTTSGSTNHEQSKRPTYNDETVSKPNKTVDKERKPRSFRGVNLDTTSGSTNHEQSQRPTHDDEVMSKPNADRPQVRSFRGIDLDEGSPKTIRRSYTAPYRGRHSGISETFLNTKHTSKPSEKVELDESPKGRFADIKTFHQNKRKGAPGKRTYKDEDGEFMEKTISDHSNANRQVKKPSFVQTIDTVTSINENDSNNPENDSKSSLNLRSYSEYQKEKGLPVTRQKKFSSVDSDHDTNSPTSEKNISGQTRRSEASRWWRPKIDNTATPPAASNTQLDKHSSTSRSSRFPPGILQLPLHSESKSNTYSKEFISQDGIVETYVCKKFQYFPKATLNQLFLKRRTSKKHVKSKISRITEFDVYRGTKFVSLAKAHTTAVDEVLDLFNEVVKESASASEQNSPRSSKEESFQNYTKFKTLEDKKQAAKTINFHHKPKNTPETNQYIAPEFNSIMNELKGDLKKTAIPESEDQSDHNRQWNLRESNQRSREINQRSQESVTDQHAYSHATSAYHREMERDHAHVQPNNDLQAREIESLNYRRQQKMMTNSNEVEKLAFEAQLQHFHHALEKEHQQIDIIADAMRHEEYIQARNEPARVPLSAEEIRMQEIEEYEYLVQKELYRRRNIENLERRQHQEALLRSDMERARHRGSHRDRSSQSRSSAAPPRSISSAEDNYHSHEPHPNAILADDIQNLQNDILRYQANREQDLRRTHPDQHLAADMVVPPPPISNIGIEQSRHHRHSRPPPPPLEYSAADRYPHHHREDLLTSLYPEDPHHHHHHRFAPQHGNEYDHAAAAYYHNSHPSTAAASEQHHSHYAEFPPPPPHDHPEAVAHQHQYPRRRRRRYGFPRSPASELEQFERAAREFGQLPRNRRRYEHERRRRRPRGDEVSYRDHDTMVQLEYERAQMEYEREMAIIQSDMYELEMYNHSQSQQ